jgi:hypothetical protein
MGDVMMKQTRGARTSSDRPSVSAHTQRLFNQARRMMRARAATREHWLIIFDFDSHDAQAAWEIYDHYYRGLADLTEVMITYTPYPGGLLLAFALHKRLMTAPAYQKTLKQFGVDLTPRERLGRVVVRRHFEGSKAMIFVKTIDEITDDEWELLAVQRSTGIELMRFEPLDDTYFVVDRRLLNRLVAEIADLVAGGGNADDAALRVVGAELERRRQKTTEMNSYA